MSYLESLRVFVRVSELGSITSGGRDLRLTPAVASKRIKELEARLGVRLFNRTTRKLTQTEIGRDFYDHARRVISALDDAEAAVAGLSGRPRGTIRLTAPIGMGRRVIAPLAQAFAQEYPEIRLNLRLSDRRVDILEDQIDMAFVLGDLPESSLKQRKILDAPRMLAASPDYLARRGVPLLPEELKAHDCLLLRYPRSPEYSWTLQTTDGTLRLDLTGPLDCDEAGVLVDWALSGAGIVNRPRFELAPHLAAGRLVEVLPQTPPLPAILACLYPHRRQQDPKIRLFADYMIRHMRGQLSREMRG
ncbi:LysR family transcriptional regulator [Natronohydrobacter thiooxidans]|jgi:DNA-binding transcriptional LysR family regulator|uniref:LysR family transcriptional regulator n=1 Tax=Natronohydrobacter thiooxidans TaxID=87172 RepID=UPI0008FF5569|nr:LysR family transcriptional regulator [Natronohydrobacter thiooxidans]